MFVLFKKKIVVDISGEEVRRVTTILDKNKIKYDVRSKRTRGSVGSALDAGSYARSNIALYKEAAAPPIVYMVYVRKKDYERAFDLVHRS